MADSAAFGILPVQGGLVSGPLRPSALLLFFLQAIDLDVLCHASQPWQCDGHEASLTSLWTYHIIIYFLNLLRLPPRPRPPPHLPPTPTNTTIRAS